MLNRILVGYPYVLLPTYHSLLTTSAISLGSVFNLNRHYVWPLSFCIEQLCLPSIPWGQRWGDWQTCHVYWQVQVCVCLSWASMARRWEKPQNFHGCFCLSPEWAVHPLSPLLTEECILWALPRSIILPWVLWLMIYPFQPPFISLVFLLHWVLITVYSRYLKNHPNSKLPLILAGVVLRKLPNESYLFHPPVKLSQSVSAGTLLTPSSSY